MRVICLLLLGAALASCSPATAPEWRGEAIVDSYAAPGAVQLFWTTTTSPDCIDFDCPPPGPAINKVLLEQSTSGPAGGWQVISVRTTSGSDSATIAQLHDGSPYWFRVVAFDVAGRQLVASNAIVTMPGPLSVPSISVPLEMSGRFSWSPSGDTIAFADASALGERGLAVIDVRSLAISHLITYAGDEWIADAIWNSDGSALAFTRTPTQTFGGIDYRVWTAAVPQGAPITQTAGRVDFDPAWGSGGWIYFCRGTYEPPNIPEIWRVMPGDPSSLQAVTAEPGIRKYSPSIRPTDGLIVYQGLPRNAITPAIYSVRLGGPSVPLTRPGEYADSYPSWSPDGQRVAFVSTRCGHSEVWMLDPASGALQQLTRGPRGANRLSACWAPNGQRLAVFDGHPYGNAWRGRLEIHDAFTAVP